MNESWTWRYVDAEGADVAPQGGTDATFPTQSDAESWLGEEWRTLVEGGVDAVVLSQDGREVYGPMSLRPAE